MGRLMKHSGHRLTRRLLRVVLLREPLSWLPVFVAFLPNTFAIGGFLDSDIVNNFPFRFAGDGLKFEMDSMRGP